MCKDGRPLYIFKNKQTAINYQYGLANSYRCTPTWTAMSLSELTKSVKGLVIISAKSENALVTVERALITEVNSRTECTVNLYTDEEYQKLLDAIQAGVSAGLSDKGGLTPDDIQKIFVSCIKNKITYVKMCNITT